MTAGPQQQGHTWLFSAVEQASLDAQVVGLALRHLVVMRCKVGIYKEQVRVLHVSQGHPNPTLVTQHIPHTCISPK